MKDSLQLILDEIKKTNRNLRALQQHMGDMEERIDELEERLQIKSEMIDLLNGDSERLHAYKDIVFGKIDLIDRTLIRLEYGPGHESFVPLTDAEEQD